MKQLVRLRENHEAIKATGGTLVAISADKPEAANKMVGELTKAGTPLPFTVACDPSKAVVKAFGIHDVDHDIALPATIILNKDGKIAWQHIADNVFDRPEEKEIVAQLKKVTTS